jgi:hypothetical protein
VLLCVPSSVWALYRTRGSWPTWRRIAPVVGSLLVLFGGRAAWLNHTAVGHEVSSAREPAELISALEVTQQSIARSGSKARALGAPIGQPKPAICDLPPSSTLTTLFVSYPQAKSEAFDSVCLQGETLAAAIVSLREHVERTDARFPLRVDLVRRTASVAHGPNWVSTFEWRPGLDGVCLGRHCLAAWQLLIQGAFIDNQPLSFIKDIKFGTSPIHLRQLLTEPRDPSAEYDDDDDDDELQRIETLSWVVDSRGTHAERRMRPVSEAISEGLHQPRESLAASLSPSSEQVVGAMAAAEAHILAAQLDDGRFRYMLDPFTGERQTKNFNLPRQAGTAFVLCELGSQGPEVQPAIQRALELLQKYEQRDGSSALAGLTLNPKARSVGLEDSALPLVAFLRCRARMGARFDDTIQRLSRLLLAMQRDDGSMAPSYDLERNTRRVGAEQLFGPGQASLALILLEGQLRSGAMPSFVDAEVVRAARLDLVAYTTGAHWPKALYPFFFIEENWHCLAARAALELERDPQYEQFCLDYVTFKTRQILDLDSGVDPLFVGGMGFGNVVPPHNTGSAGFGEALSAAIAIRKQQGLSIEREQELLALVLGFLVRQQWTASNCTGCVPEALGAISEHTHSPVTRIDFVQHAWAALGHGADMLLL